MIKKKSYEKKAIQNRSQEKKILPINHHLVMAYI
jgi:hypothetical protein